VQPTISTDRDFATRGRRFDEQLEGLGKAWAGEPLLDGARSVVPTELRQPVPLLLGGTADASIGRVTRFAEGWTAGGLPPDAVAGMVERVQSAWTEGGRAGRAKIVALAYYSLGDHEENSRQYLLDYYAAMGGDVAEMISGSALRSAEAIRGAVDAYAGVGVDELILDPTVADPAQVDALAEVVF